MPYKQIEIAFVLSFAVFAAYLADNITIVSDSRWSIHMAMSLIKQGNTDLDEYSPMIARHNFYAIEESRGHIYSEYPIAISVAAVPWVFLMDQLLGDNVIDFLQVKNRTRETTAALAGKFNEILRQPAILTGSLDRVRTTAEPGLLLKWMSGVLAGYIYVTVPGVTALTSPGVYVAHRILPHIQQALPTYTDQKKLTPLETLTYITIPVFTEHFIASLYTALAAGMIFLIAAQYLATPLAVLVTLIFAFCTSAWSTASLVLWQHGPSMFMLATTLYFILLSKQKESLVQYAGIPLALSFTIRPTNGWSVIGITLLVFIQYRRYFLKYILWAALVAILFIAYNAHIYHAILPPYFQQKTFFSKYLLEGLAGTLISPSRGLIIFSPILIFSLLGIYYKFRERRMETLDFILLGILGAHWLTISSWYSWGGGHSYGPRLFTDMLPFLIYFLLPAMEYLTVQWKQKKALILLALFCTFAGLSYFIHYQGATNAKTLAWNTDPQNVDVHKERLWEWKDPQFLRGIFNK